MGAPKIWSVEELEKMSPNERKSIVRAGFETDLSKVSPELLERTRRKIEAHISANQDATTPDQSPHRSCRPGILRRPRPPARQRPRVQREPSSTVFIVIDLPTVVDEFAENFDTLPIAYPDRPDYRVLVAGGTLVAAAVVVGQLVADDSIVLLGIEIDLDRPDEQLD